MSTLTAPETSAEAGWKRSETSFTLLLSALTALTALSIDMSLPAMPQLGRAFSAPVASVQLTLSLFLLGFAVGQLVCGPLSDRVGRRPVLLGGLTLFTVAGGLCAASPSLPLLVLFRCLQGMGASVGPVIARAIVRDCYEPRQAAGVLSQITQVMILAPLVAPTLGGYLLVGLGWPAIFVFLAGCGALLLLVSGLRLPETARELQSGGQWAYVGSAFRTVLSHRRSLRHTLTICFSYSGMFAYISGSPFVYIDVFHVSRQSFGIFFALTAAALMVGATVNRKLLHRNEPARLMRLGVWLVFGAGFRGRCPRLVWDAPSALRASRWGEALGVYRATRGMARRLRNLRHPVVRERAGDSLADAF